jgi:hypothetical protein
MKAKQAILILVLGAGAVWGCQSLEPVLRSTPPTGTADFSVYAAIGNSLTAGKSDYALYRSVQVHSFPAQLARAVGTAFVQPLIEDPGVWDDLTPGVGRLIVDPSSSTIEIVPELWTAGQPANQYATHPAPYNNLGVPTALAADVLQAKGASTSLSGNEIFDVILRPGFFAGDSLTILEQALALAPTFVTLWVGNNEILGAATQGSGVALVDPTTFQGLLNTIVTAIRSTGAGAAVGNVPDVTASPFFTTIPYFVINPDTREPVLGPGGSLIPLIAQEGTGIPPFLGAGDLVLLTAQDSLAQGMGILDEVLIQLIMQEQGVDSLTAAGILPVAFPKHQQPLPGNLTLSSSEVSSLGSAVNAYNAAVEAVCQSAGYPVVDMRSLLNGLAEEPRVVNGVEYGTEFITGGVFGLDGIHPTALGYSLVANEFIRTINVFYGAAIPEVDDVVPGLLRYPMLDSYGAGDHFPVAFRFDPRIDWTAVLFGGRP